MQLPQPFQTNVTLTFGEPGRTWLANLPALLQACCERWSLRLEEPFPLSYNYVAPCLRADGSPAVLKVGVPDPELLSEMAALRTFGGQGAVRLLEADPELGAMLLERVTPGVMLSNLLDDEQATRILARQMRRIWRPLTPEQAAPFPTLERWTRAYLRTGPAAGGRLPPGLFERADGIRREFLASQGEMVLLHGDLHHDNVLRAEREPWLVIDPKGVAGERAFEVGPLMYNPWQRVLSWPGLKAIFARRVDILVEELGLERQRLLGWGFAGSVLSMLWSFDNHEPDWDGQLPVATALDELFHENE